MHVMFLWCLAGRVENDELLCKGFGIVFVEAAACGKRIIAGKSAGIAHSAVDGVHFKQG